MTKEENRQMFADTVQSCQKGSFFLNGQEIPLNLTAEQMQEAHVFLPDDIEQLQRTAQPTRPDHPGCTLACWKEDSSGAAAAITAERLKPGENAEKPAQQHEAEVPAALQAGLVLEQDTLQINGRMMPAYFFHDEDQANGFMSNWYPSAFTLDGLQFSSAEQYIMYRKCMVFADSDRAAAVLAADTPAEQKDIARNTEYNEKVWNGIRQPAAMRGLQAKFSQNPILLQALLDTGDAYLVECSRNDKTWACGITIRDKSKTYRDIDNWKGKNILGFALMEIRTALRQQYAAGDYIWD